MATKKPRPMTVKQKKLRASVRADLREKGIIPPKKAPLNRKKFIEDAKKDAQETLQEVFDLHYMWEAIGTVIGSRRLKHGEEAIGAAKVLKVACEIKRFHAAHREKGETTYKVGDLVDAIQPILDA